MEQILQYIPIISCILLLCSIFINICLLLTLRKANSKGLGKLLENASKTANTVLSSLNVDGLKGVVGLVKDITSPNTAPPLEPSYNANESVTEQNDNTSNNS